MSEWILTDSDCCQYVNKIEGLHRVFQCIQIMQIGDSYSVCRDTFDVDDYPEEDALFAINTYGYNSIEDVISQYGNESDRIIAECIFECNVNGGVCERTYTSTSYTKCEEYIKSIVERR